MPYLHLYDSKAAHDADYYGEAYEEPWVGTWPDDDYENASFNRRKYELEYLTFEALGNNCVFTFTFPEYLYTSKVASFSYSVDGGETWVTTDNVDDEEVVVTTPPLAKGEKILFKGDATAYADDDEWAGTNTSSTGRFIVYGNIMSLLYGDDFAGQDEIESIFTFYSFFGFDGDMVQSGFGDKLLSAEHLVLPATTLAEDCYSSMFNDCTSLKKAPELPATTLAGYCYESMFAYCTSLKKAPELPATTLADSCYQNMFLGCTSLTTAPALPATTLVQYCYEQMFCDCTSLTTAPALPATTLAQGCYAYMFGGTNALPDTSNIDFTSATVVASGGLRGLFAGTKVTDADLENILPKDNQDSYCLPVTTLEQGCYSSMFSRCTSLTTAPVLPATTLANNCYNSMFWGCTSLTTAPELSATTLVTGCYIGMFQNCTSLTTAPVLPATALANSCYSYMFQNCSSLNYIKAMFTTTPLSTYTYSWVYGVAATGTFVKNSAASWSNTFGVNGIPSGWTVQTASS